MLTIALLLAAAAAQAPAAVQASDPADAARLFAAVEGRWDCKGGFASGKPLAADLAFRRSLDGRTILFTHVDRAPNSYRQSSQWTLDRETGRLVSLAATASKPDGIPGAALYVADRWTANSITLVHTRLLAEPFAPNRFTYSIDGDGNLKKLWEIRRKGADWAMGDYLDCKRAADPK